MIQIFFGDDEHTAAEGPYVRMLKARKWLYISSALAVLHSFRLIDLKSLKKLSGGLIPASDKDLWLATWVIGSGLLYLIVQYVLICFQLGAAYHRVLDIRLPDSQEGMNIQNVMRGARRALKKLEMKRQIEQDLARSTLQTDEEIEKQRAAINANFLDLIESRTGDPTFTPAFRIPEVAIDLLRAAPPLIAAISALLHLIVARPGL